MKTPSVSTTILKTTLAIIAMALLTCGIAWAHPYAANVSGTNGAGDITFIMNEAGAAVTVTFEDLTTTNLGVLPKGQYGFHLTGHATFSISCFKLGSGT